MPRKLKTYITSVGFFEEAIAAPSMKAALEAWGSDHNLFQKGFAKETTDPAIVAATMKHPGVILKRPVGSKGSFDKSAKLPDVDLIDKQPPQSARKNITPPPKKKPAKQTKNIQLQERKAAEAYAREKKRQEKQRQLEETLRKKAEQKRRVAIAEAENALDQAQRLHEENLATLQRQQDAITKKIEVVEAKWDIARDRLENTLEKAKNS